ncbi:ankyrin repeat domain-containing protein [Mucilaginibacter sp. McL0603]|uniref:ankyrin repeat domain-containing protein n=1 Tax=Mucilaginibacter sp. McL0603 TaxID=3415670 RepID=UPI003CE85146
MKNPGITNSLFHRAVEAIDSGNITALEALITKHPSLVKERLKNAEEGYFKDPYLIWFVADNPIRNDKLPPNIVAVTRLLVDAVKREAPDTYRQQIDYTLGLVATGRIPRECGVQIAMMDALIDAGAIPGDGIGALVHGNIEAAQHLIDLGGDLTLAAAICLERTDDIGRLGAVADHSEKLTAITAAAFYGKADMIRLLLTMGADPNGYPENNSGFHSHATPLHQAVQSGSLDAVKLLVEAGARLDATDRIYQGTALDWARHMQADDYYDEPAKRNFALIAEYLQGKE